MACRTSDSDRYGDLIVGQIATLGMENLRELVEEQLAGVLGLT